MTTFSVTLNIGGTSSLASPTTVTQNIASSDNISLTINTPTVAFTDWFLYDIVGCSVSSTGGLRGDTITVTPVGGNTSYYATFITERLNEQSGEFIERYGKIEGTISGGAPVETYSVSNASTNEGASATANVTTANVANGTALYWTVNATTADVSTTSGSFTISANAGSFTIPAIADSLTEGTEFYTISVRTGSTAGTVVATSTLTINDTSTTPVANDTTPDAFSFTSQTGVPLSTLTSSNEVQIFGINTGAPISITGGEYSIAIDPTTYTAFTSSAGTIYNGQSIKVRHTSSASTNTNTTTTLNIGGVQATFTSTTTSVIPAVYGMRIYDASGNITLDTTDETMKDLGVFAINSVTTNQSILGVPVTTNSIALVNNNNGDTNTSVASALVSLNISTSSITVSGGFTGFDISIRMMEF
jgi:hypothetical protein